MEKEDLKLAKAKLSKVIKDTNKYGEVVKKYQYVNEDGKVIYEVHRMKNASEPFYIARPTEDGNYKYGLGKVKTIPYNIINVLKAKENNEVIIITEGESKADLFNMLGFVATTVPFNRSDKWQPKYNKYFKYANVLIIADNDDKGREFASLTFNTILDVTSNLGILELSEICPALRKGGDIEDVRNIVGNDAELRKYLDETISNFMARNSQDDGEEN